ncbi:hypothetical protein Q5762_20385 [Streptomyces sp. P9(2023)]|uniref:hypothetical protein n=1 Tax=Streptomyces sp. P9(2023) TaxID=3064394 RepID=UPI0028F452C7|nr:hypothetical protein [Streptomyces sp. P9(2023)]MDT9690657.1 hypothetical protein [Streptomyces sp. P9(2023)]
MIIPLLVLGGGDGFRAALDFTSGVLSLVSLTASVAWGLLATDRLLLSTRHRLLAQGIHRGTAVASLGFLLLHGTVKVSLGHVEPIGALLPFSLGVTGSSALIGFGSLAGLLMVVTAATGALRSTLAGRGTFAARWRPLHMLAYPAWSFALIHGLYAGRPAATWVIVLYCLALTAVAAAVSLRMLPAPTQRALVDRVAKLLASLEGRTPPEPEGSDRTRRAGRARRRGRAGRSGRDGSGKGTDHARVPDEPATLSAEWLDRPAPGVPAGCSAAYRAVSRAAPAPEPAPYASEGAVPLGERLPLTEEIPVVPDQPLRPAPWPTPSPPMPTYATPPPMPTYAAPPSMPTYATPPPAGEPWTAPSGDRP